MEREINLKYSVVYASILFFTVSMALYYCTYSLHCILLCIIYEYQLPNKTENS